MERKTRLIREEVCDLMLAGWTGKVGPPGEGFTAEREVPDEPPSPKPKTRTERKERRDGLTRDEAAKLCIDGWKVFNPDPRYADSPIYWMSTGAFIMGLHGITGVHACPYRFDLPTGYTAEREVPVEPEPKCTCFTVPGSGTWRDGCRIHAKLEPTVEFWPYKIVGPSSVGYHGRIGNGVSVWRLDELVATGRLLGWCDSTDQYSPDPHAPCLDNKPYHFVDGRLVAYKFAVMALEAK